ncbi:hypothetical protein MHO82_13215 [Vibrio sp. Of7-15]|uniref:hypothetical protein n=1 Tax=Vibrio sp. Of7-15 TaxID=2724879 RepID=UPI001EF2B784|nr:hypothetical protein [Vibrio sp. Of7-15]MCG7497824.1 hypothetical protein [Vibrio sp. Of7-15]
MTQNTASIPKETLSNSQLDSSEPQHNEIVNDTAPNKPSNSMTIRAPRSPWWEFFLHFSTFGVYTCFWLVARVKEVKQLSNQPLKPWLWFFVPNFIFIQPFALHKLKGILLQIEKEHNIHYPENYSTLWMLAVTILSASFWVHTNYDLPSWLTLVGWVVWSALFCVLGQRLNGIKKKLTNVDFKGKPSGYAFWEWLIVIPFFPIVLCSLLYISIAPYTVEEISSLPDQTVYTDPDNQFQLTIHGEGWREVEIGTFSDGSAELELAGTGQESSFIVFKTDNQTTLNGVIKYRLNEIQAEWPNSQCREERNLIESKLNVIAYVICEEKDTHDYYLNTVTVFENGDDRYELFGSLSARKHSYPEKANNFKKIAKEFQPL